MSRSEVAVVAYDDEWPVRAATLIDALIAALGPRARRIDHIGSTAIPVMQAKNVLDIQVSVDDLDFAVASFDAPLRMLGFLSVPYEHDHVPAGRLDAAEVWVKRLWFRRDHPDGDVNLHVRTVGSPNERLALLFRDWFRAHSSAIAPYSAFKRALAAAVSDIDAYADVKDPVVDLVVSVAEEWASITGWNPY